MPSAPTPAGAFSDSDSHGTVSWTDGEAIERRLWRAQAAPPRRVEIVDDRVKADHAFRLASEGVGLLWRGDYQNARQLLQALARRIDQKPRKPKAPPATLRDAFNAYRQAQAQRARTLGMVLIELDEAYRIALRRAPDVAEACLQTYGPATEPSIVSLRELLGLIGAYEWRKAGVEIAPLGARIHPHHGVFSPVRGEYIDLVANAPLPADTLAFDIGTGTGVLAALLAKRGVARVVATEIAPRALACARDNVARLGLTERVDVVETDLFPDGQAPLIVCNPPWLPGRPSSPLESAIYDPDSRMLKGFLAGLAAHLAPQGEGWLILSDFAEHLGLRTRAELLAWVDAAGLRVLARSQIRPRHPRASDRNDPLHAARRDEMTSLWRLAAKV
ncbi:methyltransferase [Chitinasiproducens palmae]